MSDVSTASSPIGVFDSGVGGLSFAREIRATLPGEQVIYLADSAYCPYGGRPLEEIRERTLRVGHFLLGLGAKALVVACNSASGAALEALRAATDVPVIGMEPAVKPAAAATRSGRVGVMATAATLRADRFERLMRDHAGGVEVVSQACPGLVELVERGETSSDEARAVLEPLVAPLRTAAVDTVVLGCTHYPFLRAAIGELLGREVTLIDTGEAVARQTRRVLEEAGTLGAGTGGSITVYTTGDPATVGPVASRLLGLRVEALFAEV
jgi:glutamate racemase